MNEAIIISQMFKSKFTNVDFNEKEHQYKIDGKVLPSVTQLIKKFEHEFDVEFHARRIAERDGKTPEQVKKEWKLNGERAANAGTDVHAFAESYAKWRYFGDRITEIILSGKYFAVIKFFDDLNKKYIVVGTEVRVYSKKYGFAGTIDLVLYNLETKKFVLVDYKTNEKLYDDYGNTMQYPFDYLPNTNFNKYQLQLSMYQIPMEEAGFEIGERYILWLKSDSTYELLEAADFTNILKQQL